MVDADQCRPVSGKPLDQPLGDTAPRPILSRARRRLQLDWRWSTVRRVDPQPLQARCRGLRPGIVDSNIVFECGHELFS